MKRFIFIFVFVFVALFSYAQITPIPHRMNSVDFSKYEVVDSLPINYIMLHFNKDIDDESFISLGNNDYMAPVPHKDNMIIKMTPDKEKAIVIYNSYVFGRHFEFNIKETDRRMILWFEDKHIYCGYIYDKKYKVGKYFESRKEYKRFMRHPFFKRDN